MYNAMVAGRPGGTGSGTIAILNDHPRVLIRRVVRHGQLVRVGISDSIQHGPLGSSQLPGQEVMAASEPHRDGFRACSLQFSRTQHFISLSLSLSLIESIVIT